MMTGGNKGKERERDPEAEPAGQTRQETWPGYVKDGKWYCDCNRKATCYTVNDVAKANYGKKFWTCPKPRDHRCTFFLWDDYFDEAREWHAEHGPPHPAPETPKATENIPEPPKDLGNPWTKSITKRKPKSREVSDEDENAGPSKLDMEVAELSDFEDIDTSSRKVAKVTRFSTPGRTDKCKSAAESLPTPDTGGQPLGVASTSRPRPSRERSPPPQLSDAIVLRDERKLSLSATVLKLIHSEKVALKESIAIQIEHEIDSEVAVYEQKLRGLEATNKKLSKRLDEMENMVLLLSGDVAADDNVEFSE